MGCFNFYSTSFSSSRVLYGLPPLRRVQISDYTYYTFYCSVVNRRVSLVLLLRLYPSHQAQSNDQRQRHRAASSLEHQLPHHPSRLDSLVLSTGSLNVAKNLLRPEHRKGQVDRYTALYGDRVTGITIQ